MQKVVDYFYQMTRECYRQGNIVPQHPPKAKQHLSLPTKKNKNKTQTKKPKLSSSKSPVCTDATADIYLLGEKLSSQSSLSTFKYTPALDLS